jgi:AraC family transcriptional regulator
MRPNSLKSSVLYHRPETLKFHREAIEKVILLMQTDPSAELDWDILARTACISRYHFLRIFEGLTQYSPHRFLVALRMDKAKRLLLETSLSIADLAYEVGYSSSATFIRVFKMTVGMSPTIFRRMAQNMSFEELKPLLATPSVESKSSLQPTLTINLRAPAMFNGIIFVGLFDAGFPHGALTAGAVINHVDEAEFNLPMPTQRSHLHVIGFNHPSSTDIKDYLLVDRNSLLMASVVVSDPSQNYGNDKYALDVCLQYPSFFDPPISSCLPLLLLNLVRGNYCP